MTQTVERPALFWTAIFVAGNVTISQRCHSNYVRVNMRRRSLLALCCATSYVHHSQVIALDRRVKDAFLPALDPRHKDTPDRVFYRTLHAQITSDLFRNRTKAVIQKAWENSPKELQAWSKSMREVDRSIFSAPRTS